MNVNMQMPANTAGALTGKWIRLSGPGLSGNSTAMHINNEQDASTYTPNGGPLSEPTQIIDDGYWDTLHFGGFTPLSAAFKFATHQPGQTSYDIWRDPSWGTLTLDNTDNWHFSQSGIVLDQGSITATAGAGFFGYGIRAGVGDGVSNGAGAEFTFAGRKSATSTWLTQCDLTSDAGKTDLCVTDQGGGRSGNVVTPNRGLQAGSMAATFFNVNPNGSTNGTISFGANYGADAIDLYANGTGKYYWGLNAAEMQFGVADNTTTHFSFNAASGGLQPSGTNEYARLTPRTSGGGWTLGSGELFNWSSTSVSSGSVDTGISRHAAGDVRVGNGTFDDVTGTVEAASFFAGTSGGAASEFNSSQVDLHNSSGIQTVALTGATGQVLGNWFKPGTVYTAAGTALPTCNSTSNGTLAVVGDATSPTYMGAYTSGGQITAAAICSFNGTSYSWLTH
jgi:hypothetical protein